MLWEKSEFADVELSHPEPKRFPYIIWTVHGGNVYMYQVCPGYARDSTFLQEHDIRSIKPVHYYQPVF